MKAGAPLCLFGESVRDGLFFDMEANLRFGGGGSSSMQIVVIKRAATDFVHIERSYE